MRSIPKSTGMSASVMPSAVLVVLAACHPWPVSRIELVAEPRPARRAPPPGRGARTNPGAGPRPARRADLPAEVDSRRLARRALQVILLLGILVLVAAVAPGLDEVRDRLGEASPGWIAAAVVFEILSALSYVLMFRPVFCSLMKWRSAAEVGLAEVGMGSIIPASGAGGIALGAWVLSRAGMPAPTIARRSVAFLLLKSSVNFAAVTVVGLLVFAGVLGPAQPVSLTLVPAVLAAGAIAPGGRLPRGPAGPPPPPGGGPAAVAIALVALIPRVPAGPPPGPDDGRALRLWRHTRAALVTGVAEAGALLRRHDPVLIIGIVGYWAWDNLVLWATFEAVGSSPGPSVILLAYLIGQLGGLIPIPGGIGGIDGGLIGAFIVFGAPVATTTAAVLAYRLILFWIPLVLGGVAFLSLRRSMAQPAGFIPCAD